MLSNVHSISGCPNRISDSSSVPRVVNNRVASTGKRKNITTGTGSNDGINTMVYLLNFIGVSAVSLQRQQEPVQSDPCFPSPCGTGAQCRSTGNRAVSVKAEEYLKQIKACYARDGDWLK